MRILYSHYLQAEDHAAVRMVQQIAEELRELGHEVIVHRSAGPATTDTRGKAIARRSRWGRWLRSPLGLGRQLARNLTMYRRDRAALSAAAPDVVLVRQDAYCWSMTQACQSAGVPMVTYADAPVALETRLFGNADRWHPPGLVEAIERWSLKRSRAIITVSRPAARALSRYNLDVPIHVVPNGVNLRGNVVMEQSLEQLREQLKLSGRCVIGFLGTFRPFHGLDLLKDVLRGLAHRADVHWLLVGDGPGRLDLERALEGATNVTFLGHQPAPEVARLLRVMEIALVPQSRVDGEYYFCPLKVLECAAAGCAVVAGNQGDVPWLLEEGASGVLLPPEDRSAWIQAIESLIDAPALRRQLGNRAAHRMSSAFTWRHTARKIEAILRQSLTATEDGARPGASTMKNEWMDVPEEVASR